MRSGPFWRRPPRGSTAGRRAVRQQVAAHFRVRRQCQRLRVVVNRCLRPAFLRFINGPQQVAVHAPGPERDHLPVFVVGPREVAALFRRITGSVVLPERDLPALPPHPQGV